MPDAFHTTPSTPPPTYGDFEGLSPPVLKRKRLIPSISQWLVGMARRNPFASAIALCMVLVGGTAGVVNWSYNRDMIAGSEVIRRVHNESGVVLLGHGYGIDLNSRTMSIEWEIMGCGAYRLPSYPPPGDVYLAAGCDYLDRAVDIYFNGVSKPTFSYDPANFPSIPGHALRASTQSTFGVNHVVDSYSPDMVPFDTYSVSLLVFVIERATNASVPIVTFAACEGSNNFFLSSVETQMISTRSYNPGTGPTTEEVHTSTIEITAIRSQLAQAFTLCLLLINWALAIGSTYVTVAVVIRKERVNEGVLLLPVTIVLTIPTLRNLYVGSPPFGIYLDTFGFFLQMMTVALCSMILLYVVATPSAQGRRASCDSGNSRSPGVEGNR